MNADVCILTEGTFPYVMGGVSNWIAQLIESMPDLKFSVLDISASSKIKRKIHYDLPKNLVGISDAFIFDLVPSELSSMENLQDVFLFDYAKPRQGKEIIHKDTLTKNNEDGLLRVYKSLSTGKSVKMRDIAKLVQGFDTNEEFIETMAHSYSSWEITQKLYEDIAIPGLSFLDYFWSLRAQFMPIFNILRASMPKARVYHAACTGYAGLLGARAAYETGRPLILTEHGIYSRERRIELEKADWLSSSCQSRFLQLKRSRNWFRDRWISLFQSLSHVAYDNSSKIISLFRGNAEIQIKEGAPREKVEIIPNGIITDIFKAIPIKRKSVGDVLKIGFVGRVVSIKDIKTLLRAMVYLMNWDIPFQTTIIGPLDEEPEYVDDCLDLLEKLNLQDKVSFVGPRKDLERVYSEIDILLLTSVSEGFPYVILEANCAGLPVVATEVGACRDILTGINKEDRALGPSGQITAVGNPEETAAALARFARNPDLLYSYGQTGRERTLRYYDLKKIMQRYRNIYNTYIFAAKRSHTEIA